MTTGLRSLALTAGLLFMLPLACAAQTNNDNNVDRGGHGPLGGGGDLQVLVEVRVVTLADPFFERLGVDLGQRPIDRLQLLPGGEFGPNLTARVLANPPFQILDQGEEELMPGKPGNVRLGRPPAQVDLMITAIVSANRRFVTLRLGDLQEVGQGQQPDLSVVSVGTTVSVPDGGTVLLGGIKKLPEEESVRGVPLLDKLPYVDRLFRNVGVGRETDSLMLMVTPRIIIEEEE